MVKNENELKKECNCRRLDVTFTVPLNLFSLARVPGIELSASEASKMLLFSSEDCKVIKRVNSTKSRFHPTVGSKEVKTTYHSVHEGSVLPKPALKLSDALVVGFILRGIIEQVFGIYCRPLGPQTQTMLDAIVVPQHVILVVVPVNHSPLRVFASFPLVPSFTYLACSASQSVID